MIRIVVKTIMLLVKDTSILRSNFYLTVKNRFKVGLSRDLIPVQKNNWLSVANLRCQLLHFFF